VENIVLFYHDSFIPHFSLFFFIFPANCLFHKIVWYSCLDSDRIGSASPKQIHPFIWYKCRCFTLCWVSVDLTLTLSIQNTGYQTSALTIISTLWSDMSWS
jgi:hypothetical protein